MKDKIRLRCMYPEKHYKSKHYLEVWDWCGGIGFKNIHTSNLDGVVLDIKQIKKLRKYLDKWIKKGEEE